MFASNFSIQSNILLALTLIGVGFFYSLTSYAQLRTERAKIRWGAARELPSFAFDRGFIAASDNLVYNLSIQSGRDGQSYGFLLEAIDEGLNVQAASFFNADSIGEEETLETLIAIEDQLYLLSTQAAEPIGTQLLCARHIHGTTLRLSEAIDTVLSWNAALFESVVSGKQFQYAESPDQSKLLVYKEMRSLPVESPKYAMLVLDKDLKTHWSATHALPFSNKRLEFDKLRLLNNGTATWIARMSPLTDVELNMRKDDFLIAAVDGAGMRSRLIPGGDRPLAGIEPVLIGGELHLIGFFGEPRFIALRGTYYGRWDISTMEVISETYQSFEESLIMKSVSKGQRMRFEQRFVKGKTKEFRYYKLREPIQNSMGGMALLAEQYYVSSTASRDANGTEKATYYYHYEDLLIHNFDREGQLVWSAKVPKHQISKNDNGNHSSYAATWVDERLVLMYYDHPINLYYKGGEPAVLRNMKNEPLLLLVELDGSGELSREPLLGDQHSEFRLKPAAARRLQPKVLMIAGSHGSNAVYARIEID